MCVSLDYRGTMSYIALISEQSCPFQNAQANGKYIRLLNIVCRPFWIHTKGKQSDSRSVSNSNKSLVQNVAIKLA